jgi:iron complex outermembrane recepter protein
VRQNTPLQKRSVYSELKLRRMGMKCIGRDIEGVSPQHRGSQVDGSISVMSPAARGHLRRTAVAMGIASLMAGAQLAWTADAAPADAAMGQNSTSQENPTSPSPGLQEIIVTAQKRQERLQDVPISISVLGGKDLDTSAFSGVTEALNTIPGVSANANQVQFGGTILTDRGVSSGGRLNAGASPVAYYIDSVPFGEIRNAIVPDPNVYDLQQIEVLNGPQGTLYGANALNGVVRVLTFDPDLNDFDYKVRGALSTTESGGVNYGGDMAVNIPIIEGALAARVVIGNDHKSGWIDGPLGTHLNSGDLSNARIKLSARPTDELSILLSAWHSETAYNYSSSADSNNLSMTVHPQPMYTQFNALGAKINYDFSAFTVNSMTSYVDYATTGMLDLTAEGAPITADTEVPSRVYAEEITLTSKSTGPWRWSVGSMYRDARDIESINLTFYNGLGMGAQPTGSAPLADFYTTSKSEAVYGELSQRFLQDKLQWTLGLRYFNDDEETQAIGQIPGVEVPPNKNTATSSAMTPRAVLTWFPKKDLTVYASYSQGFRSGAPIDELVRAVAPDFPAVKPDKLTNYEVGIKGTLLDQLLSYDAAVYYMQWRNIQQAVSVPDPQAAGTAVAVVTNEGSASGQGADLSLKTQQFYGLSIGANFSWNTLHFDSSTYSNGAILFPEGSRPDYSPKYTGGLSAQYAFPLGGNGLKGVFSLSGNYISPLDTTFLTAGSVESNSLLMTRGSFGIDFPEHWTAALFVDNANNWHGTQQPYPGVPAWDARLQPRTYGVTFNYHLR